MLPNNGGLEEILFPMTADIYYAESSQTEYGNVLKNWKYNRTIQCSAITEMADRSFVGELKTKGTDFVYESNIYFRTPEDIRKGLDDKYHPITAISITNIKDSNGRSVWINGRNKQYSAEPIDTKYEVKTIVPTFNYDHSLRHWRTYISKSQNQRWDNI